MKHGYFSGTITTARTGYVPGDKIIIDAGFENATNILIRYYSLKLVRNLKYFANGQKISEYCTVSKLRRDKIISPGETDTWEGVTLRVPDNTQPSGLGGPRDSIIQLEYSVELHVKKSGFLASNQVLVRLPIIIGTHSYN